MVTSHLEFPRARRGPAAHALALLALPLLAAGALVCGGCSPAPASPPHLVLVEEDLVTSTSWSPAHVYVVTRLVRVTAPLAIAPGTVVQFVHGAGLDATAAVTADAGSDATPIVFTSHQDDATAEGDVNGDGTASAASPGDWRGIRVSAGGSAFRHCRFLYAGEGDAAALAIVGGASAAVGGSTFAHHRSGLPSLGAPGALEAVDAGAGTAITGNVFYDDVVPLRIGPRLSLDDSNVFEDRAAPPGARRPSTFNAVVVTAPQSAAVASIPASVAWRATGVPFVVGTPDGNAKDLVIEAGQTLTLGAGVVVKLQAGLDATVTRQAGATLAHEVNAVLTSIRDDVHGGDTNGDGTATAPGAGDWYGVALQGACESWPGMHHFRCGPARPEGPRFTLGLSPATVGLGSPATFSLSLGRVDADLTGLGVAIALPPGLLFSRPTNLPVCFGSGTMTEHTLTISGGSMKLPVVGCGMQVEVSPLFAALHELATVATSSEGGPSGRASAALTVSPGAGGRVFSDGFDRADGPVGRGWFDPDAPGADVPTGLADLSGGALRLKSSASLLNGDPAWADVTVTVRFQVTALQTSAALQLRWDEAGDYYEVRLDAGASMAFGKMTQVGWDPALARSAAVSYGAGTWHTVQVVAKGGRITATLDGAAEPQLDVVDPSPILAGRVGLFASLARAGATPALFDDVVVTAP